MSNLLVRAQYARKALMNPNLVKFQAIRALSGGHVAKPNPHGWKSWKDIPDSALPKCPDPSNPLYEMARYKKIQKKKIWHDMNRHIPIYFREGTKDKVMVYSYVTALFSLLIYEYYIIVTQVAQ